MTVRTNSDAQDSTTGTFVGAEDIAELLRVPKGWVYDQVALNAIPHRKCGKYLRFDPERVLAAYPEQGGPANLYEGLGPSGRAAHAGRTSSGRRR